jgi:hypothetical protein
MQTGLRPSVACPSNDVPNTAACVRNCSSWRSPRSAWSAELIGQRLDLLVELLLLVGELSQHRGRGQGT